MSWGFPASWETGLLLMKKEDSSKEQGASVVMTILMAWAQLQSHSQEDSFLGFAVGLGRKSLLTDKAGLTPSAH